MKDTDAAEPQGRMPPTRAWQRLGLSVSPAPSAAPPYLRHLGQFIGVRASDRPPPPTAGLRITCQCLARRDPHLSRRGPRCWPCRGVPQERRPGPCLGRHAWRADRPARRGGRAHPRHLCGPGRAVAVPARAPRQDPIQCRVSRYGHRLCRVGRAARARGRGAPALSARPSRGAQRDRRLRHDHRRADPGPGGRARPPGDISDRVRPRDGRPRLGPVCRHPPGRPRDGARRRGVDGGHVRPRRPSRMGAGRAAAGRTRAPWPPRVPPGPGDPHVLGRVCRSSPARAPAGQSRRGRWCCGS